MITLQNRFAGTSSQLRDIVRSDGWKRDAGVTPLVQAMATYLAGQPGFNPATAGRIPTNTTLQNAITAAWHH